MLKFGHGEVKKCITLLPLRWNFKFSHFNRYDFVRASVVESGVLSDLWPTNTPSNIEGAFKWVKNLYYSQNLYVSIRT